MSEEQAGYKINDVVFSIRDEWQLLELAHDVYEFQPGIYFLFKEREIVYVGKSLNTIARIYDHQRAKSKDFDAFAILPFPAEYIDELEIEYICKFTPKYNTALTVNDKVKSQRGWAVALGVKIGVVGKFIRKNKIHPYTVINGQKYYHKLSIEGLIP